MKQLKVRKILIPLDFSFTSLKALEHAVTLAKLTKAEITLLHIIENQYATTDPFYITYPHVQTYETDLKELSNQSLQKVADKIKSKADIKVNILSTSGRTHKEIIRVSKKMKADIIVIGTHGVSGFREFVMGSNTFSVVRDAPCPVISVQRKSNSNGFKDILVPFSDSPHSREKVMYAIKLAEIYGATVHILGIDTEKTKAHIKKIALEADQIKEIVEEHGLKSKLKIISGLYDAKTVLNYAKKVKADLIATMGDVNKQDLAEYFTGSFSQQLINHSQIPVLSIHSEFNPDTIELWHGI